MVYTLHPIFIPYGTHLCAVATEAANTMVGPCGDSSESSAASSAGLRCAGHRSLNSVSSLGSLYLHPHKRDSVTCFQGDLASALNMYVSRAPRIATPRRSTTLCVSICELQKSALSSYTLANMIPVDQVPELPAGCPLMLASIRL